MNPCRHGHVDGAFHKPCYQCRSEAFQAQIDSLKQTVESRNLTIEGLRAEIAALVHQRNENVGPAPDRRTGCVMEHPTLWERFVEEVRIWNGLENVPVAFLGSVSKHKECFDKALAAHGELR